MFLDDYTVPTFKPSTKYVSSEHIRTTARLITIQFPGHGLATERSFDSQVTRAIQMCLPLFGVFLTCYLWVVYNQTLADVGSNGAGIKCLY